VVILKGAVAAFKMAHLPEIISAIEFLVLTLAAVDISLHSLLLIAKSFA
jgi:hypothetical protein